jgi:hypothetical protein
MTTLWKNAIVGLVNIFGFCVTTKWWRLILREFMISRLTLIMHWLWWRFLWKMLSNRDLQVWIIYVCILLEEIGIYIICSRGVTKLIIVIYVNYGQITWLLCMLEFILLLSGNALFLLLTVIICINWIMEQIFLLIHRLI